MCVCCEGVGAATVADTKGKWGSQSVSMGDSLLVKGEGVFERMVMKGKNYSKREGRLKQGLKGFQHFYEKIVDIFFTRSS